MTLFITRTAAQRRLTKRFLSDSRGVAMIEFALIAPVMLVMMLGMMWGADIMQANRHLTYAAGTLADLASQEKKLFNEDFTEIFLAVEETLKPFDYGNLKMIVTSVEIDEDGEGTVHWSESNAGLDHSHGSTFKLPNGLNEPNTTVIVAEMSYDYEAPIMTSPLTKNVSMDSMTIKDEFFVRPRRSNKVERCYSEKNCI